MRDVLMAADHFEGRVAALEENYAQLDTDFAARVAAGLGTLALSGPLGAFAAALRAELLARGSAGLYDPQVRFPGDAAPTGLLAFADDTPLGRRVRLALDAAPATLTDGLIQALVDLVDDPAGDEGRLSLVTAPLREVAFSPRQMMGRVTAYVVRREDDLFSVAQNLYGDPDRWADVVRTYDLTPPYFSASPRAGCLSPGTQLVTGESRLPDAEVGALGETMALTAEQAGGVPNWDIQAAVGGGIAVVGGMDALLTDCALRLATPLGDLPGYPTYGMPDLAGVPRTEADAAQYMLAAETLKDDARVGAVTTRAVASGVRLLSNVVVVPASSESVRYG